MGIREGITHAEAELAALEDADAAEDAEPEQAADCGITLPWMEPQMPRAKLSASVVGR